jgi:hypothetical protein
MGLSKDKSYFKQLAKEHPHLMRFIANEYPKRFANPLQITYCDMDDCFVPLTPTAHNIFVTPAPAYKPLLVCNACLQNLYAKHGGNDGTAGGYDKHTYLMK